MNPDRTKAGEGWGLSSNISASHPPLTRLPIQVRWLGVYRNRTDDGDVKPFTFYNIDGTPYDIDDDYVGCTVSPWESLPGLR